MLMPGADRAVVANEKVTGYLLSSSHPVGRFKAPFFSALGYALSDWEVLRDDLIAIAQADDAGPGRWSLHGDKFEIRATLHGPNGRAGDILTVWIVLHGEDHPRFVTAHPG